MIDSSPSARRLRAVLTIVFAVAAVALLAERAGYAGLYRGELTATASVRQLGLALPSLLDLAALWQLRMLMAHVAGGRPFAVAAAQALQRAGLLLIAGSSAGLLIACLAGGSAGRLIEADVSTLIIAAIGLALLLVARLFDQARAIKEELDEIF